MLLIPLIHMVIWLLSSHIVVSFRGFQSSYRRVCILHEQKGNEDEPEKKKSTKFDRAIDDFIGKRYGAGEAFYGKRMSDLDEETYEK